MIKQAMILAAGRGNRMMPLTRDIPKSMLKIGNMTLIEDKIVRLAEAGIEKIIINIGYLGSYIKEHVGDGSKYGVDISISDEGSMPIGTANGIRKVLDTFNDDPFILVNADIWTNYLFIDLKAELVEKLIVLFASSTWASATPVLSLFLVIEGHVPAKIVNGQTKLYSNI